MIWFKSNCWSNFSWIMHFLGWQIKCLKDPCIKNGPIWASSKNLPFFLDVTSKLFQHISGFSDVKYQMTWCMEHEKYPNCVRLSTVVSVIDDLLVTVDRNTLYISIYPLAPGGGGHGDMSHEVRLLPIWPALLPLPVRQLHLRLQLHHLPDRQHLPQQVPGWCPHSCSSCCAAGCTTRTPTSTTTPSSGMPPTPTPPIETGTKGGVDSQ